MIKIVITGIFHKEDIDFIQGEEKIKFFLFPYPYNIGRIELRKLKETCKRADLLIIGMFGSPPETLEKFQLEEIKIPKVYWSFDSHHWAEREIRYAPYFKKLYISHSNFLTHFREFNTMWLPCCFHKLGIKKFIHFMGEKKNNEEYKYDISFPHRFHPIGDREEILRKIEKILRKHHLKFFTGSTKFTKRYLNIIHRSKVILNISLNRDLNIRNFEAWGLNRILLSDFTPDHQKISPVDYSCTVFFKRDLIDFENSLEKSLTLQKKCNTFYLVIFNHMLLNRYLSLINDFFGTNFKVNTHLIDDLIKKCFQKK